MKLKHKWKQYKTTRGCYSDSNTRILDLEEISSPRWTFWFLSYRLVIVI